MSHGRHRNGRRKARYLAQDFDDDEVRRLAEEEGSEDWRATQRKAGIEPGAAFNTPFQERPVDCADAVGRAFSENGFAAARKVERAFTESDERLIATLKAENKAAAKKISELEDELCRPRSTQAAAFLAVLVTTLLAGGFIGFVARVLVE